MRVAILAESYLHDPTANINGTLVQLHNLAQGFKREGVEVHYVCRTKNRDKPEFEIVDGIKFHWIKAEKGIMAWKQYMKHYQSFLNTIAPDAIYVRGRNVMQHVAGRYAQKQNINYVWGTNGDDSAEFYKQTQRLKRSQRSYLKKIVLWPLALYEDLYINRGMIMADIVVNQSEWQQKETKRLLNKDGVVLPSFFLPMENTLPKEDVLLWLANLSRGKQPEHFIDIVAKLNMQNWKAILAGGTSDRDYQKEVEKYDRSNLIEFSGKVPFKDSFKYYQKAKIFINTSLPDADGLPNAYIQSWLSGTVTLSLYHDPNNWMEKHNIGYCANGDVTKLVEKLQYLMQQPQELASMSINAIEFANNKFSNPNIIRSYITLFNP